MIFLYLGFINFPLGLALGLWWRSAALIGTSLAGLIVTLILWYSDRRTGWLSRSESGER